MPPRANAFAAYHRQTKPIAPASRLLILIIAMTNVASFNVLHASAFRVTTANLLPVSLIRGQCKSTCLRNLSERNDAPVEGNSAADDSLSLCIYDSVCSACHAGCEASIMDNCPTYCLSSNPNYAANGVTPQLSCNDSCKLLQSMILSAPTYNPSLPLALINEPRETSINIGDEDNVVRESALDIEWSLPTDTNMTRPVLFVLEARFCIGPSFDEQDASPWRQITTTSRLGAVMSDVKIGWRYQFRLAVVSAEGSRGFRTTTPMGLKVEPRPPTPPENLTEVRTTLRSNRVDVEIRWDAPKQSDLEVYKYKIYWSRKLDEAPLVLSSKEYSRATIRNENSYVIEDLEPDAVYSVSVQAISLYGPMELQSIRNTFYISTLAIASANDSRRNSMSTAHKQLFPVIVNHTFYEEDDLRAMVVWPPPNTKNVIYFHVSWRPVACIGEPLVSTKPLSNPRTVLRYSVLNKLIFDCRYEVIVRPITGDDRQLIPSIATFDTPSCLKVQSRYGRKLKCNDARPLPAVSSLSFKVIHVSDESKFSVNISWRPQLRSHSDISNYRVVWGRDSRQTPAIHKLSYKNLTLLLKDSSMSIDKNDAVTKVLPRNATWLLLTELHENVLYTVAVTALSTHGDGPKSQHQFFKPSNASLVHFGEVSNGMLGSVDSRSKSVKSAVSSKQPDSKVLKQVSQARSSSSCLIANALLAFLLATVVHISAFVIR